MKKTSIPLRKLFILALLFMASVFTASAADFMVDSICYNIIGEGEVEVTRRDVKYSGEVIIPATVVNDGMTYQVTRIGKQAFTNCGELTLIGIPEGVTEIGYAAFESCKKLENVDLPNSLVSIGNFSFFGCTSFTVFSVPRNLAEIAYNAINGCNNLAYFTCSSMNTHFKAVDGVLYSKDLTKLVKYPVGAPATTFVIPSTVTELGDYCFCGSKLVDVTIPESVTWMGMNIFRDCKEIVSVYIPDGVTHMGVTVFGTCSKLEHVHLPASLDSILSSTFSDCPLIEEITIPRNVKFIDEYAFYLTNSLKTITFEEGSQLEGLGPSTFFNSVALESFDMPNTVRTMGRECFHTCRALKDVHLSESLEIIDGATFVNCYALTELYVPSSVEFVGNIAFKKSGMKKLTIGAKDAPVRHTVFDGLSIYDMQELTRLELGSNVDSLYSSAIDNLPKLKVFISWGLIPPKTGQWSSISSSITNSNAVLYVPRAALEAYSTADQWKNFRNIVAIEDVGDVNADNAINISDAIDLINILLNDETPLAPALTDVNLDGEINISDAMELINRLISER